MRTLFLLLLSAQFLLEAKVAPKPKAAKKAPPPKEPAFLHFGTPELKFAVANTALPLGVCLQAPPTGAVTIYIEAPNFTFSQCKLDFTPENWNKQQILHITPHPYLTPTPKGRVIQAKFVYSGKHSPEFHKRHQFYNIHRTGKSGVTCTASGDPHYKSFAKRLFDFQGQGPYYLVKSPDLTVQQTNRLWTRSVTVQVKVAIRYKKTVYVFDGHTRKHYLASDTVDGVTVTAVNGVQWRLVTDDGSSVRIGFHGNAKRFHLSTTVVLGESYLGKVRGLCGATENKNFLCADGKTVGKANIFGATWKVPDTDNLFVLGEKAECATSYVEKKADGGLNACKIPNLDKEPNDGTNNLEKGEVIAIKAPKLDVKEQAKEIKIINDEPRIPAKAPTDGWAKQARAKCKESLTIKDANAILDPKIYVDDCTDDCVLSGTFEFIDEAKRTYLEAVRRFANSAKAEPSAKGDTKAAIAIKELVEKAGDTLGMDKKGCPKDCNGKGKCIATGCACNEGFTGIDCGEEVPKAPTAKEAFTDKPVVEQLDEKTIPEPKIGNVVDEAVKEQPAAAEAKGDGAEAKKDGAEAKKDEGEAKKDGAEAKKDGAEAKKDEGEAKKDEGEAKKDGGEAKKDEGEAKGDAGEAKKDAEEKPAEEKPAAE